MNEKVTIQSLAGLLAARHNMNDRDAEAFVKEFFLLIEQALENEKVVKIKGWGTFRLVDMEERESVNINTGERFQIKNYTKVTFTPDASLKDTINKPFAHFETVVLNDNTVLEDTLVEIAENEEETEEEKTAVEENVAGVMQESDQPEEEPEANIVEEEEKPVETATAGEGQENGQLQKEPMADEMDRKKELLSENDKKGTRTLIIREADEKTTKTPIEKEERSFVAYLTAVIVVVLLLCGGMVFYLYFPDWMTPTEEELPGKTQMAVPAPTEVAVPVDTIVKDSVSKAISGDTLSAVPLVQPSPTTNVTHYSESVSYEIAGTKTKHTVKAGETLMKISLRFYGTKAMWPYIVKHNPKVIKNPDNVPYGTVIAIPELVEK